MRGLIILGLWLALQEASGDLTYYFDSRTSCQTCEQEHKDYLDTLTDSEKNEALEKCATGASHVFHWDCGRCINGIKRRPKGSDKYLEEIYSSLDCELSSKTDLLKTEEVSMDKCIKQGVERYSLTS